MAAGFYDRNPDRPRGSIETRQQLRDIARFAGVEVLSEDENTMTIGVTDPDGRTTRKLVFEGVDALDGFPVTVLPEQKSGDE